MVIFQKTLPVAVLTALALTLSPLPALSPPEAHAGEYPAEVPDRILMLGNSLSRGLRREIRKFFEADGLEVRIKARTPSGWTLTRHAASNSTPKRLAKEPWDIVILQEQSAGIDEDRYPGSRALDAMSGFAGAQSFFFMTWRDRGAPPSAYNDLRGTIGGSVGYVPIAFELDAPLGPVGWAFRQVVIDGTGLDLWSRGGRHASREGKYLAGAVLYASILGRNPALSSYTNDRKIDPAVGAYLRSVANNIVLATPADWNLPAPLR